VKPTWTGSLDVAGDMLSFVSLRGLLTTGTRCTRCGAASLRLSSGEVRRTDRPIATHNDFSRRVLSHGLDPTRCYHTPCLTR